MMKLMKLLIGSKKKKGLNYKNFFLDENKLGTGGSNGFEIEKKKHSIHNEKFLRQNTKHVLDISRNRNAFSFLTCVE